MGFLNKEGLLKKQVLKIERVDLNKEDFLFVREMTGHERDQFERSMYVIGKDNKIESRIEDFRAKLAVCTICDETGILQLTMKDYLTLSTSMSAASLERIVNKAQELNKITEEDKEGLLKNSEAVQDGNYNSDSV